MGVDLIRLKQLHRKRETRDNMAAIFRCSRSTVDRALKLAGLYYPWLGAPEAKRTEVLRAYRNNVPLKRIHTEYGVPPATVCLWARQANVPFRRKGSPHVKPM